jgi:predicted phosphodiesterase
MKRMIILAFLSLSCLCHGHEIHTNRENPRLLPLPKDEENFHFLIFGDRTGGPPEGIKILAQAAEDANLLDPDLVMTVGDLIQGYNENDLWMKQMEEYQKTLSVLRMPWFPVAGNHDIFWRGKGPKPATEHEGNYEKHFGPLWYWFEHKKCGFLVLFSDEGDPSDATKPRDFNRPEQQKFSEKQLEFLEKSLAEMKDLKHVFLFMHHPRWASDIYPGNNWDKVHQLLVRAGNVKACFAGHIHRLRYDGKKDGIEYFALAATGGQMPGVYPGLGYLHHYNLVSVRPGGIQVSTMPVGTVMNPRDFTPEHLADMDAARAMTVRLVSPPPRLAENGTGSGMYEMEIVNPAKAAIEVTLTFPKHPDWVLSPDHQHLIVPAQERRAVRFQWSYRSAATKDDASAPRIEIATDYLGEKYRVALPVRVVPLRLAAPQLPEAAFAPSQQPHCLKIAAKASGARVDSSYFDLPNGPMTLETWVYPTKSQEEAGIVAKTEQSDYALSIDHGKAAFMVFIENHYAKVVMTEPIALNRWTHLAGVYDGKEVRLYVDGMEVAQKPTKGARVSNALPLYIGADPNRHGLPSRPFHGHLDEIRLSKVARYEANFAPQRTLPTDAECVLHFRADRLSGNYLPDHSPSRAHAVMMGEATIIESNQ